MKEMFLKFMIIVFSVNFSVGYAEIAVEEEVTVTVNGKLVQGASSSGTTNSSGGTSKKQKPLAPQKRQTNGAIDKRPKRGPKMGIMSPEDRPGEEEPSEDPSNGGVDCNPTTPTEGFVTQEGEGGGSCVAQEKPPCVETEEDEMSEKQCWVRVFHSNQRMECVSFTHYGENCPEGSFSNESCNDVGPTW